MARGCGWQRRQLEHAWRRGNAKLQFLPPPQDREAVRCGAVVQLLCYMVPRSSSACRAAYAYRGGCMAADYRK